MTNLKGKIKELDFKSNTVLISIDKKSTVQELQHHCYQKKKVRVTTE